ncbi:hypothetical protein SAMN05421825_3449 [Epilithonimonas hungarica]|uniref:Uncharacterized protein n=2 Tax=Epilithonimonas TaxID=2782229 RepID=A0A1G7UID0_9FLAO|nr:hypothetical protein SAMN05421825_3449 [Epilithonimonas hungarica]
MFIKVYTSKQNFLMVNIDHIVYISPGSSNRGCTVHLDTGVRLESIDDYDVLLNQLI